MDPHHTPTVVSDSPQPSGRGGSLRSGGPRTALLRSRSFWLRVVLACFVLLNGVVFAFRARIEVRILSAPNYRDPVSTLDEAFVRALPHLPPHGQVGYLKPDFSRANAGDLAGFYQAQYAVAPRIVVEGALPDVVIAVAREGDGLPEVPHGFEHYQTLSGRLALYRRTR